MPGPFQELAGASRIFFTIDDRQHDVWVMDVTRSE